MSPAPDGLTTLATVRRFLADLVSVVPDELAGEVRAAVKLLETAETELNERHVSLTAEIEDLLGHCCQMGRLLRHTDVAATCEDLSGRLRPGHLTLTAQEQLRYDTRALAGSLVADLQDFAADPRTDETARRMAKDALAGTYACLGAHASSRLAWQSVFPHARPEDPAAGCAPDREDLR